MKPERWEQVELLYHAALEREPPARAAFLAEACAGDEDLRREVASLLAHDDQPTSFIEAPILEGVAREAAGESGLTSSARTAASAPSQIGAYQILSLLGRGGMGEVWLARDPRLGRKVAIKLLPSEFTQDAERVRRFEQEARAASSLNHPNIITIHEIGEVEGKRYLVTEHIEGETLRQHIENAPQKRMRLTEALEIAAQIASALQAAHEAGIMHRDIKPENVVVRKDGLVKVLDFGLAKLTERAASEMDAETPTRERFSTDVGAVMGTVAYMSPEQVRGLKLDHRTDIFSLGVILYEMMAGRRPVEGKTASDLIAAVLMSDPVPLAQLAPQISPALQRIVMRCLEKQPEKRFQSAGDLSFALEALSSPSDPHAGAAADAMSAAAASGRAPTLRRRLSQGRIAWIVAGVLALAVIWFAVADFKHTAAEVNAIRFLIPPPENASHIGFTDTWTTFSVSPNGQRLVFVAKDEKRRRLWVRPLDSLTAQPLEGTDGAMSPFWSPDGREIGFFADGKLKKIAAAGGLPTTLCAGARYSTSGTWNRDGVILFPSGADRAAIYRISAAGGEPMPVTKLDPAKNEDSHLWPHFLPDGRHFLYLSRELVGQSYNINLGTLDSNETKPLIQAASRVAYALGYLLYVREGILLAQPFDARQLRKTGEPVPVAEHVSYFASTGRASFSVSDNGVLVYATVDETARLVWYDRSGKEIGSVGKPENYSFLQLSPDEEQVVTPITDPRLGTVDLWLQDLTRNNSKRLTSHPGQEAFPVWSPDNLRLVYSADRAGPPSLYLRTLSDEGEGQILTRGNGRLQRASDWSQDGKFILYSEAEPQASFDYYDVYALPLSGDRQPIPLLHSQFDERDAHFSPDGRWIAYISNESGQPEVYVRPFQQEVAKKRISTGGGDSLRWRRDGKEIFYIAPSKEMMAVTVKMGANVEVGLPTALFKADPAQFLAYDVTRDGQRFLICTPPIRAADLPLTVVLNWTAELKR